MVSFTNHYNIISIDRLPTKTKIGKYLRYFNNSLLCKSKVSSATMTFIFLLKLKKNKYSCNEPRHLKVEVADEDFPNYSYVINRTCQYPMFIMGIKSIKKRKY